MTPFKTHLCRLSPHYTEMCTPEAEVHPNVDSFPHPTISTLHWGWRSSVKGADCFLIADWNTAPASRATEVRIKTLPCSFSLLDFINTLYKATKQK